MPFSPSAVAFLGAYYKLQSFLFMPMNGLGQAAIPIVGYSYGAKNNSRIWEALKIMLPTAVFLSSVTIILGYAMSGLGNGLINMTGTALRQLVVFVPLAYLFASYFGIDKVWYSVWIAEIAAMCFTIAASRMTMQRKLNEKKSSAANQTCS